MTINPNYDVDSLDVNKDVDDDGNVTVPLYNAQHGKTPRTGGPYLDDVEREQAEIRRAKMENREPDLDNPPPTAGTVLVPKSMLVERDVDKNHLSDTVEVTNEPVASYVVPAGESKPDPAQANWDNDSSKVAALQGAKLLEELQASPNLPSEQADAEREETETVDSPQPDGGINPDSTPEELPREPDPNDKPDNVEPVTEDTPDEDVIDTPTWNSEEELNTEANPNTRDV